MVLGTGARSRAPKAVAAATVGKGLSGLGPSDGPQSFMGSIAGRSGITSFQYRRNRPFHPLRLHNLVVSWRSSRIFRSKGFVWVASMDDVCVYWAHAGKGRPHPDPRSSFPPPHNRSIPALLYCCG